MAAKHTPGRRIRYMRARTEFLRCVVNAHAIHEAARYARLAGDNDAADFYAQCAVIERHHAASFAAIAKATGSAA